MIMKRIYKNSDLTIHTWPSDSSEDILLRENEYNITVKHWENKTSFLFLADNKLIDTTALPKNTICVLPKYETQQIESIGLLINALNQRLLPNISKLRNNRTIIRTLFAKFPVLPNIFSIENNPDIASKVFSNHHHTISSLAEIVSLFTPEVLDTHQLFLDIHQQAKKESHSTKNDIAYFSNDLNKSTQEYNRYKENKERNIYKTFQYTMETEYQLLNNDSEISTPLQITRQEIIENDKELSSINEEISVKKGSLTHVTKEKDKTLQARENQAIFYETCRNSSIIESYDKFSYINAWKNNEKETVKKYFPKISALTDEQKEIVRSMHAQKKKKGFLSGLRWITNLYKKKNPLSEIDESLLTIKRTIKEISKTTSKIIKNEKITLDTLNKKLSQREKEIWIIWSRINSKEMKIDTIINKLAKLVQYNPEQSEKIIRLTKENILSKELLLERYKNDVIFASDRYYTYLLSSDISEIIKLLRQWEGMILSTYEHIIPYLKKNQRKNCREKLTLLEDIFSKNRSILEKIQTESQQIIDKECNHLFSPLTQDTTLYPTLIHA